MITVRRLVESCVVIGTDTATTLIDPGSLSFETDGLDSIGQIDRVLITHEHHDHVNSDFVRWLIDRGNDLSVHANDAVARLLEPHGISVSTQNPPGVDSEDVLHEMVPNGATPPNRSFTVDGVFTHPGDSYQPTSSAAVLALPLLTPWGTATKSVEFARRLEPTVVVPVHDSYLNAGGRQWIRKLVGTVLADHSIELIPLDWGESATI